MEVDRFLKESGRFSLAYHSNPPEILTADSLERELARLKLTERVLVPEIYLVDDAKPFDEQSYTLWNRRYLSRLLVFPVTLERTKKTPLLGLKEVASYLRKHFVWEGRWRNYVVMNQEPPPPRQDSQQ